MLCNVHLLCFSPVYSPCPQPKSQSLSTFKLHSLSPAQSSSGASPSTLLFWSTPNSSRSLYDIYFLLLEHSLFSSSMFTTACYSTSPEIQSFHLTRPPRFLHWSHSVLQWDHLYLLLVPSSYPASLVFYWILLVWVLPNSLELSQMKQKDIKSRRETIFLLPGVLKYSLHRQTIRWVENDWAASLNRFLSAVQIWPGTSSIPVQSILRWISH